MPSNPILIISGPEYSYDKFIPLIDNVSEHFDEIIRSMKIKNPKGEDVNIKMFVEGSTPEKIRASAKRVCKETNTYEIRMTAGLSYQIWLISRAFLSGANYLPWIKNIKLEDKVHKKSGRKSMIADYAFYLSSYFILLHEISHVVLGHCDFVKDEMGFDALNEYEDEIKKEEIPEYDIKIRHAFEVEADRQAGEFLVGFFEESLGKGGLGKKIKFPSKKHAYEFYTYTITLICVLIQQLGLRRGNIHPKPNVRQYIILSSVKEYFDKVGFPDHKVITDNIVLKMLEAAKKTGLLDAESPKQMIFNAILLGEVDDIKKDINIKDYQFTVI